MSIHCNLIPNMIFNKTSVYIFSIIKLVYKFLNQKSIPSSYQKIGVSYPISRKTCFFVACIGNHKQRREISYFITSLDVKSSWRTYINSG